MASAKKTLKNKTRKVGGGVTRPAFRRTGQSASMRTGSDVDKSTEQTVEDMEAREAEHRKHLIAQSDINTEPSMPSPRPGLKFVRTNMTAGRKKRSSKKHTKKRSHKSKK